MNIFVLDLDPRKASEYHNDRHVVKMILETAQLLCTTHHQTGNHRVPYRSTHINHPCAIWARESLDNYLWLRDLGLALANEYSYRYEKIHKTQIVIEDLKTPDLKKKGLTDFELAMPEEYVIKNDIVGSYRNYYRRGKSHLAFWKKRGKPFWW